MPFPSSWVDALFAKLAVRYGAAFMAQWNDADPAIIKADWREVLDGLQEHPEAIRYALDNLPDRPLTAVAFRSIARRSPEPSVPKLPESPADQAKVDAALAAAKAAVSGDARSPAQKVLAGIVERCEKRAAMSRSQRDFAATCITMLRDDDPLRAQVKAWIDMHTTEGAA